MPDETPTPEEISATDEAAKPVAEAVVEEAAAPAATIAAEHEEALAVLQAALGPGVIEAASNFTDLVVRVAPEQWAAAATAARDHLDCDFRSFVSVMDCMPMPLL